MNRLATIAILHKDGTLTSVRVYQDVDPEYLGKTLIEFYSNQEKVEKLLKGGDLVKVEKLLTKCKYSSGDTVGDLVDCKPKTYRDLLVFYDSNMGECDHLYICRLGKWYCFDCNR